MTADRNAVLDSAVYAQLVEHGEISAIAITYTLRTLAIDVVEASLVRLADAKLVETTPDGRWRARMVNA